MVEPLGDEVVVHGSVQADLASVARENAETGILPADAGSAGSRRPSGPAPPAAGRGRAATGRRAAERVPVQRGERSGDPMNGARELDLLVLGDCNPDLVLADAELVPEFGQAERLVERAELHDRRVRGDHGLRGGAPRADDGARGGDGR